MRHKYEYSDAGVYMMRSRKSGAFYIGATRYLSERMTFHRRSIVSGKGYETQPHLRAAFAKHAADDIEFRVLERITAPFKSDYEFRRHLSDCERGWIVALKPTLNRNKTKLNTGVESFLLPHGVPDDLKDRVPPPPDSRFYDAKPLEVAR